MMDILAGRVWKFGDDINTDLMVPAHLHFGSPEEQARAAFGANRPGWAAEVGQGDILVCGKNFGTGSGRPAPRSFRILGITCLVADSINGLFFRSCVNFGLPALECPGVSEVFEEGQQAEISLADFTVKNLATGITLQAQSVPPSLLQMMREGGLYPLLEKRGLIAPLS